MQVKSFFLSSIVSKIFFLRINTNPAVTTVIVAYTYFKALWNLTISDKTKIHAISIPPRSFTVLRSHSLWSYLYRLGTLDVPVHLNYTIFVEGTLFWYAELVCISSSLETGDKCFFLFVLWNLKVFLPYLSKHIYTDKNTGRNFFSCCLQTALHMKNKLCSKRCFFSYPRHCKGRVSKSDLENHRMTAWRINKH